MVVKPEQYLLGITASLHGKMQFEVTWAEDQVTWIHAIFLLFLEHVGYDSHFKHIVLFNPHKALPQSYLRISLANKETEHQRH